MFRNLNAEQARLGMTDEEVAQRIGISRSSYISKKNSGKFTVPQIRMLLTLFGVEFEYLFATDNKSA